jgi:hypothetical protein
MNLLAKGNMSKLHFVQKARKDQGPCIACCVVIKAGEPYKWQHPLHRAIAKAHNDCTIPISAVSSSKMVAIWEAQAEVAKSETADGVAEALRDLATTANDVATEYRNSASNMREYFPESEKADKMEEKADALETWATELEAAADAVAGAHDGGVEDAQQQSEDAVFSNGEEELDSADIETAGCDAENNAINDAKSTAQECPGD